MTSNVLAISQVQHAAPAPSTPHQGLKFRVKLYNAQTGAENHSIPHAVIIPKRYSTESLTPLETTSERINKRVRFCHLNTWHDIPNKSDFNSDKIDELFDQYNANPKNVHIAALLGKHYFKLNMIEPALYYSNRVLELTPDDVSMHIVLGDHHFKSHNYEKALQHFTEAHKIENRNPSILSRLSAAHKALVNIKKAFSFNEAGGNTRAAARKHRRAASYTGAS